MKIVENVHKGMWYSLVNVVLLRTELIVHPTTNNLNQQRTFGRHRHRWADNINMDLKK
jgi:hypothetical protein